MWIVTKIPVDFPLARLKIQSKSPSKFVPWNKNYYWLLGAHETRWKVAKAILLLIFRAKQPSSDSQALALGDNSQASVLGKIVPSFSEHPWPSPYLCLEYQWFFLPALKPYCSMNPATHLLPLIKRLFLKLTLLVYIPIEALIDDWTSLRSFCNSALAPPFCVLFNSSFWLVIVDSANIKSIKHAWVFISLEIMLMMT